MGPADRNLAAALCAGLSGDTATALAAVPDLDERLTAALAAAQSAWPDLDVSAAELMSYVAARLPADAAETIGQLRIGDLYLACACTRGDDAAIAAFQRTYFGEIDFAARRARAAPDIAAEARQNIGRVLFSGPSPAIADYAGRGDLRGWVRVTAMREVLRLLARAQREIPVDDEAFLDALSPAVDPELGYVRSMYRDDFDAAFRTAVAALSDRERELLRRQLIDGTTIDELAAMHGVHRATAARWFQAARKALLDGTRRELEHRLGASSSEVDSIIRLLVSRIDVSLERLLMPR